MPRSGWVDDALVRGPRFPTLCQIQLVNYTSAGAFGHSRPQARLHSCFVKEGAVESEPSLRPAPNRLVLHNDCTPRWIWKVSLTCAKLILPTGYLTAAVQVEEGCIELHIPQSTSKK